MKDSQVLHFLLGATAAGKSAVALELARQDGAAILCLDAMQVYRGADIGTGKPTAAERGEIPHGGLDLAEFGQSFDVARYLEHAAAFLREQRGAGRAVIAVGGTGLYFRALTTGLCEAPRGSEALRNELQALPVAELRARLERVDPGMVTRVDAANPRRLARAVEVMETTGRSLRAWQEMTPAPLVTDYRAFWLEREKSELDARIEARVDAMLAAGWAEEVRGLVERHGSATVRAFPAIGYGELADLLEGRRKAETVRHAIVTSTRQYAKRQLTWFRREPSLRRVMLSGNQPVSRALLPLS